MENNIFYVYMYLDPRKSGWFEYKDIKTIFEPIYVGKGNGNRDIDHLTIMNCKSDRYKTKLYNKLRKLQSLNIKPIIIRYRENLSETDSHNLEIELIRRIGREDKKLGPLCNLTDGGDGITGKVFTKEWRENMSKARKGKPTWNKGKTNLWKRTEESKELIRQKLKGMKRNEQQCINNSRGQGGKPILQYSLEGNFIKEWNTISELLKLGVSNLSNCLYKNKHYANGYLWYKKETNEIPQKVEKYIPHKSANNFKTCQAL